MRLLTPGTLGIIIDVETSGFSRSKNALIEVAAVVVDHNYAIVSYFHTYIRPEPGTTVEPGAAAVNGYTPQRWGDFGDGDPSDEDLEEVVHPLVSLAEANEQLHEWASAFSGLRAIAHNKGFDKAWVNDKLPMLGRLLTHGWYDTQTAYRRRRKQTPGYVMQKGDATLGAICDYLRYEATTGERWVRHTALDDCYATRFVAWVMDDAGFLGNA